MDDEEREEMLWDRYTARKALIRELINYDNLKFLTHATTEEEHGWARVTEGCFACGTTQPDCEMTWEVDEEALAHAPWRTDGDPRVLIRPRRWFCAVETETDTPWALCPSCYRLIQFDCYEGVWDAEFMDPSRHLQMILPFADTEAVTVTNQPPSLV